MRVGVARSVAVRWVEKYAQREPDFVGAFFTGSTIPLGDNETMPATSDINVVVVVERDQPANLSAFTYHNVLLEVSYVPWARVATPELVLSSYRLAWSFRHENLIADPTGCLRRLHDKVSPSIARRQWVRRRCLDARHGTEQRLRGIDDAAPLYEQVARWLAGMGGTTHLLLTAALRNPTGRLRFVAAREVLTEFDYAEVYPDLLELLGCVHLTNRRVQHHLRGLTETYDATVSAARSSYFIGSDVSPAARPMAIDGSQALIDGGYHREAMFWMLAIYARCQQILAADAPRSIRSELAPLFEAALTDLGLTTSADVAQRADDVLRFLPRLWKVSEGIVTGNSAIRQR